MNKEYTAHEIANLIGVSVSTILNWEDAGLIVEGTRVGRLRKRIWGRSKVLSILEYARDTLNHNIPERIFASVRGEYGTTEKK